MSKSFRNIEHILLLRRQRHSNPLSISFATRSDIHCNIKYLAMSNSHKLSLSMILLKMQSSKNTLCTRTFIILYKFLCYTCLSKYLLLKCFHEVSTIISKHLWSNDHYTRKFCFFKCECHRYILPLSILFYYH